jgi:predicted hydrocarbon binding protein
MRTGSEPTVRLRGNFFARPDYFRTDVAKGVTRTPTGTRICALTGDFMLGFRDALIYECGKSYRLVMKNCGKRWGKQFALRFDKEMSNYFGGNLAELSVGMVHACLADAFNYHGWGRLRIDLSQASAGLIQAEITDSFLPAIVKESDRPADLLMTGLLAALFSHFARAELDAVQTDCPTRGADASRFIIAAPSKIEEIEKWLDEAPDNAALSHATILKQMRRGPAKEAPAGELVAVT